MKSVRGTCLVGSILILGAGAQKPVLRQRISVEMAVGSHSVETRAADGQNATVLAITEDGKVYDGIKLSEPASLNSLRERTMYVKVDPRAPYQSVLAVLDALRGKSVVLLSAPPENSSGGYTPPYGTKLSVFR